MGSFCRCFGGASSWLARRAFSRLVIAFRNSWLWTRVGQGCYFREIVHLVADRVSCSGGIDGQLAPWGQFLWKTAQPDTLLLAFKGIRITKFDMGQLDHFHLFLVQLLRYLLRKFLTSIIEKISEIEVVELRWRLVREPFNWPPGWLSRLSVINSNLRMRDWLSKWLALSFVGFKQGAVLILVLVVD